MQPTANSTRYATPRRVRLLVTVEVDAEDTRTAEQIRRETDRELGGVAGPDVHLLDEETL